MEKFYTLPWLNFIWYVYIYDEALCHINLTPIWIGGELIVLGIHHCELENLYMFCSMSLYLGQFQVPKYWIKSNKL